MVLCVFLSWGLGLIFVATIKRRWLCLNKFRGALHSTALHWDWDPTQMLVEAVSVNIAAGGGGRSKNKQPQSDVEKKIKAGVYK